MLSSSASLYYGQDLIGSTRDVLVLPAATTQAYDYDACGDALQAPAIGSLAGFRFAGMVADPVGRAGASATARLVAGRPRAIRWASAAMRPRICTADEGPA
jgi:hypothetical protein